MPEIMIEITAALREKEKRAASLEHELPFDPTYGYGIEKLLAVPSPEGPADFVEFWEATYREARSVELALTKREVASPDPDFRLFEVEFNSLGGLRIGGWITIPAKGEITCGKVVGHGYGPNVEPQFLRLPYEAASLYFCARGFRRSANPSIPANTPEHVVHGMESRESYVWRGCVADVWCAASALLEVFPEIAGNLFYSGASFGGGLGALALPWDARFKRAYLGVPTFGNQPLRVSLPCTGSGDAVSRRYREVPGILEVLAYFDAATAARYIKIPTLLEVALFDPAVVPPGQFAVANAIPCEKQLFVRVNSHSTSPFDLEESLELERLQANWFRQG